MEDFKEAAACNLNNLNNVNNVQQNNKNDTSSSTQEKIKMKKIYKPLKKLILEEYIIFLCKGNIKSEKSGNFEKNSEKSPKNEKFEKNSQKSPKITNFEKNSEKSEKSKKYDKSSQKSPKNQQNEKNQNSENFTNYCNSTLFISSHIDMLLTYENLNFSFIFNNLDQITSTNNFHIEDTLHNKDEELNQFDCIYSFINCSNCHSPIGRFIHSTPEEKDFLLNKFLILSDKVKMINNNFNSIDIHSVKYSDYIKCKIKESEEIKELSEINAELYQTNEQVLEMANKARDYLKIKDGIRSTENYIENLNKLTKYVEYSFNRLGIKAEGSKNV
jgi:hypothetical protein